MKLKLDENIDPRAKEVLTQAGHDVLTAPEEALSGVSDDVVAAAASRDERCYPYDVIASEAISSTRKICGVGGAAPSSSDSERFIEPRLPVHCFPTFP